MQSTSARLIARTVMGSDQIAPAGVANNFIESSWDSSLEGIGHISCAARRVVRNNATSRTGAIGEMSSMARRPGLSVCKDTIDINQLYTMGSWTCA